MDTGRFERADGPPETRPHGSAPRDWRARPRPGPSRLHVLPRPRVGRVARRFPPDPDAAEPDAEGPRGLVPLGFERIQRDGCGHLAAGGCRDHIVAVGLRGRGPSVGSEPRDAHVHEPGSVPDEPHRAGRQREAEPGVRAGRCGPDAAPLRGERGGPAPGLNLNFDLTGILQPLAIVLLTGAMYLVLAIVGGTVTKAGWNLIKPKPETVRVRMKPRQLTQAFEEDTARAA